jgi:hypothetical protein
MTTLTPTIEQRTDQVEGDVLDAVVRSGEPLVVVKSPPGAGKTHLVETVSATTVHYADLRVAVVTPRAEQSYDFVRRLVSTTQIPVQLLQASKRQPPDDLVTLLGGGIVTDPRNLRRGAGIVVGTAAKFAVSLEGLGNGSFHLVISDEAYQLPYRDFALLAALSAQHLLVGDPGQLPPLVSAEIARFEAARHHVHWPAPQELLRRHPGVPVIELPATRRFPQDSVDFVQPAFYPELPFVSAVDPVTRAVGFAAAGLGTPIDRALDLVENGATIVGLVLPASDVPVDRVDPEVAALSAALVERMLQRGIHDGRGHPIDPREIGGGDAHVASGQAFRDELRRRSIGPETMVETPEIWQGLQRDVMVVKHPLSGATRFDQFGLEPGRWCVMLSRHRRASIIVTRDGIGDLLDRHQHDCASRAMGVANAAWDGWRAHAMLWRRLEEQRRLIRL